MTVSPASADLNLAMVYVSIGMKLVTEGSFNDSLGESITTERNESFSGVKVKNHLYDIMIEYYPVAYQIHRIVPFVCYAIGFFGNTISAAAWFHSRLSHRNSSAVFLALLSVNDLVFLVLHCAAQIDALFELHLAKYPSYCEIWFFVFFAPQYMTPLLVLGFTTERYVAVCHPLIRRVLCRTRMAVSVCVGMTITSVLLASIHPVLWTYSAKTKYCALRESISGIDTLWLVWSLVIEVLIFLLIPVVTFVMDALVIRCLFQIRKNPLNSIRSRGVTCKGGQNERGGGIEGRSGGKIANKIGVALVEPIIGAERKDGNEARGGVGWGGEGGGRGGRIGCATTGGERKGGTGRGSESERPRLSGIRVPYQATTAMLLSISLFEIVTIVPVSVHYLLRYYFRSGPSGLSKEEMLADPTWQRYFPFVAAKFVINPLCMTRNAALIFFYLALGPRFRETLWDLIRCRKPSSRAELTQSTYAGSSGSVKSQHQVELAIKR